MNERWRSGSASYRVPDDVIQTRAYEIVTMAEREVKAFIVSVILCYSS